MLIISGLILSLVGLWYIFGDRDLQWELTKLGNRWEGVTSERTSLWKKNQVFGGIVTLILGFFILNVGINEFTAPKSLDYKVNSKHIRIIGLAEPYTVEIKDSDFAKVTITGPRYLVNRLGRLGIIDWIIDLEGFETGTYHLTPEIQFPRSLQKKLDKFTIAWIEGENSVEVILKEK